MRKIVSILLSVIIMTGSVSALAAEEKTFTYNEKEYNSAISLMQGMLGENIYSEEIEKEITREEFVAGIVKTFGIELQSEEENVYTDISGSAYINEIVAACEFGLVAKAEKFNPENEITAQEAATIVDRAFAYGNIAEQFGGYPNGYMYVAKDLGIFNNTSVYANTDKITVADASIMFKNIMFATQYDISFEGKNLTYKKTDRTYIEDKYNVYKFEGQVTAVGNHSVVMNANRISEDNYLEIDGRGYSYSEVNSELLGKKAYVYAVDGSDKIVWVEERKFKELLLSDESDVTINEQTLTYVQNNRNTNVKLNDAYKVIYNGRRAEKFEDYMIDDMGVNIRLLDCEADGTYDILFIDRYIYGYVTGVDWITNQIGIKIPGKMIDLSDENEIEYSVHDAEGAEIELFRLEPENVVAIQMSEDNFFYDIRLCDKTVSGTVKSISESNRKIVVGDTEYDAAKAFIDEYVSTKKLTVGKDVSLVLGMENQIVYMTMTNVSFKYGYLKKAFLEDGSEKTEVKIYTENEVFEEFELADKVTVGNSTMKNNKLLCELLQNNGEDTVVKYVLNGDNKIKKIIFADSAVGVSKTDAEITDGFFKFYDKTAGTLMYRTSVGGFNSTAFMNSAKVMIIPTEEEYKNQEDKYYFSGMDLLVNSQKYSIDIYDVNDLGMAGLAVIYDNYYNPSRLQDVESYIISDVTEKAYNEKEDEVMSLIECYGNGKFYEFYLPDTVEVTKTSGKGLCVGDIVRLKLKNDIIKAVFVDYDFSSGKPVFDSKGNATNSDDCYTTLAYTDGGVYNYGNSTILLCRQNDLENGIVFSNEDIKSYLIGNNVICYDSEDNSVRPISKNSIHSYLGYGELGDYAVIRQNFGTTKSIFVYR